jgi:putative phage-type endonuclease
MIIQQRSPEWLQIRRGKITSSEIHKIMSEKGLTDTAKTYLLEKVCEHFGGVTEPASGQAIEWGTELEPLAIDYYANLTNTEVEKASFNIVSEFYGGSPDGTVKPDGIIEVKCPFKSANHFKHGLINSPAKFKKIAPNYYYQCMSNMICAKAMWCDFISFDPRVSPDYQMFIYRLELDPEETRAIKDRLEIAVEYMRELREEIQKAKPKLLLG